MRALLALALVACVAPEPPAPPSLDVPEYLGEDDDALAIPTREWLLGPWVVDVHSLDPEVGELTPELVTRLHNSVLVLEPDRFRFQDFVGPEHTVHLEGALTLGEVDRNGEVALTFAPEGEAPRTDAASRFGLTLFLAPPHTWHVWRRPSHDPRWRPARAAHLAEMLAELDGDGR